MSKFKPGPWASDLDFSRILFLYNEAGHVPGGVTPDYKIALKAALRCMELVPVLVEALEMVSRQTGIDDYGDVYAGLSFADDEKINNALKMAMGEE